MDDLQTLKQHAASLLASERLEEAGMAYERFCTARPHDIDGVVALAAIAGRLGRYAVAEEYARRAVALRPNLAVAHTNLGNALSSQGRVDEALEAFQRAVAIAPRDPLARYNLGKTLADSGRWKDALGQYRRVLRVQPRFPQIHYAIGRALERLGRIEEAVVSYTRAVQINPRHADPRLALASLCGRRADPAGAIKHYRGVLDLRPDDKTVHSDLLLMMNYLPDADPASLFDAHRAWGASLPPPRTGGIDESVDAGPERRLRIGYVSADFREHSVKYFIRPLLEFHDPSVVEVVCYSDVLQPDGATRELAALAVEWRDTSGLSKDDFCRLVRQDSVDILVDLAGHTGRNRLEAFSRGLTPVQVSYLGYPNTTGLRAMHYRLTDSLADPDGQEAFHTERLARLPGCFLCYRPPHESPSTTSLPARRSGHVTFGSFSNLLKINREVINLWAMLLNNVSGSHLFLKTVSSTNDPAVRRHIFRLFKGAGVSPDRIDLQGPTLNLTDHLSLYGRVDVALDPFPYNGATTTCEALWMGVPVITLAGNAHRGRVGASLLNAVGLGRFVAETPEQYLMLAAGLAADLDHLAELRTTLRRQVSESPLCDAPAFARKVEAAYRDMWRAWCAKASGS